ncbi:MAG: endonuclease/exonuclease/phosphatase family protein [Phycisphaerae bacterium]|nr:endonuclease/exonuclease/phosphatase family protein [Phycisphaerae bacterium]
MRRILILAVLAVTLAGCQQGGIGQGASGTQEVRAMSFNIRYGTANDGPNHWSKRREMVFQVFRDHRPDVVGLQEAMRFQLDEIRQAVPEYGEISAGRDDGKSGGEASAILYCSARFEAREQGTFWLSDTPEVPGSRSWGNNITRICTWARLRDRQSGVCFYMFNTHLDHQSQPARELGAELIAQRMGRRAHPDPLILTGDFNAGEGNPVVRYLKGQIPAVPAKQGACAVVPALVDTFRVLHPDAKVVGTFNGFAGKREGEKIDYVLASPESTVAEAAIVYDNTDGRYPSDHFPVKAVLRLYSPAGANSRARGGS